VTCSSRFYNDLVTLGNEILIRWIFLGNELVILRERITQSSDDFWSAFCVFHAHFWEKNAQFQNMCAKKLNDFRQLKNRN